MSNHTLTEDLRIRVSEATRAKLEEVAEREERSVAAVVRRAVREYLERQETSS